MRPLPSAARGSSAGAPLRMIDLYAGAGGMTLGFTLTNLFRPVWANDINAPAVATYNANFGEHCICGDITELLEARSFQVPAADVVIGGPPCQGFSLLNKNRSFDPRKALWRPFMDVVASSGARAFVIENVPQLLSSPEHDEILAEANRLGFSVTWSGKLLAADYGVPQTRSRAFIIGFRDLAATSFLPPAASHRDPTQKGSHDSLLPAWRTVRDAIGELSPPVGTEIREISPPLDLQFGRRPTATSILRYKAIPDEGMNRFDLLQRAPELTPPCWHRKKTGGTDLFGRLWWDRPAFTIRTEFYKPEKGRYLHPVQHRPITHREAARFQSFPDDFQFTGSKIEIAKQIGNAVPPLLAAAVARAVAASLLYRSESCRVPQRIARASHTVPEVRVAP